MSDGEGGGYFVILVTCCLMMFILGGVIGSVVIESDIRENVCSQIYTTLRKYNECKAVGVYKTIEVLPILDGE